MAIKLRSGDIFLIPLPNGKFAVGQVLARERDALNSVGCAFFGAVVSLPGALEGSFEPIAVLLVTPELLTRGTWRVISNQLIEIPVDQIPYERYRSNAWVGVKITGSGIIEEFLAAYHGLHPWDDWHDPNYLDSLLLPGIIRPEAAVFKRES